MRVLVCGGRDYSDRDKVFSMLDDLHTGDKGPITLLIEGGASGADNLAQMWAAERGVARSTFWANWRGEGRAAGPIRNAKMLADGKPDLVVAFPGGRGTQDMCRRARAAGVEVVEVT